MALSFDCGQSPLLRTVSAQIREHVPAIIMIPGTGSLETIELGGGKRRGGDGQSDRLVQTLLACQADATCLSLIGVLVTVTTTTFHTSS
jgi:hypothetical protein